MKQKFYNLQITSPDAFYLFALLCLHKTENETGNTKEFKKGVDKLAEQLMDILESLRLEN